MVLRLSSETQKMGLMPATSRSDFCEPAFTEDPLLKRRPRPLLLGRLVAIHRLFRCAVGALHRRSAPQGMYTHTEYICTCKWACTLSGCSLWIVVLYAPCIVRLGLTTSVLWMWIYDGCGFGFEASHRERRGNVGRKLRLVL